MASEYQRPSRRHQDIWVPRRRRRLIALGFPDVIIETLARMRFGRASVRRLLRLQERRIRDEVKELKRQGLRRNVRRRAVANVKRRLTADYRELADAAGVDVYGIAIDNTVVDMGYRLM